MADEQVEERLADLFGSDSEDEGAQRGGDAPGSGEEPAEQQQGEQQEQVAAKDLFGSSDEDEDPEAHPVTQALGEDEDEPPPRQAAATAACCLPLLAPSRGVCPAVPSMKTA